MTAPTMVPTGALPLPEEDSALGEGAGGVLVTFGRSERLRVKMASSVVSFQSTLWLPLVISRLVE